MSQSDFRWPEPLLWICPKYSSPFANPLPPGDYHEAAERAFSLVPENFIVDTETVH
jgi:hypothetical protein